VDHSHREHHESFCRRTSPARHLSLVAEDGGERSDHAQNGARDGHETADPRDAVQPRERYERYRGAEDDRRLKRLRDKHKVRIQCQETSPPGMHSHR
jgi:hypothetical protein